jgi:hypothetical protein
MSYLACTFAFANQNEQNHNLNMVEKTNPAILLIVWSVLSNGYEKLFCGLEYRKCNYAEDDGHSSTVTMARVKPLNGVGEDVPGTYEH